MIKKRLNLSVLSKLSVAAFVFNLNLHLCVDDICFILKYIEILRLNTSAATSILERKNVIN